MKVPVLLCFTLHLYFLCGYRFTPANLLDKAEDGNLYGRPANRSHGNDNLLALREVASIERYFLRWRNGALKKFVENLSIRQSKKIRFRFSKTELSVCYHYGWWDGVSVLPPDMVTQHNFQSWAQPGGWEEATMRIFDQELHEDVDHYIGFGAWIGPTGLFAATRVQNAILLDSDPYAYFELAENIRQNIPSLKGSVTVDPRCISNVKETVEMAGNGASNSAIQGARFADVKSQMHWSARCIPLLNLLKQYDIQYRSSKLFVKIDTEGAESFILPSLSWMTNLTHKPVLFVSMHNTSNFEQRKQIAELFNAYRYFAAIEGRNPESSALEHNFLPQSGITAECPNRGVPLIQVTARNSFTPEGICAWCDYLLTDSRDNSVKACE